MYHPSDPTLTHLNRKLSQLDPAELIASLAQAPALPRHGARVRTPAGVGVFVGAADTFKRGTFQVESTTATVEFANGRRFFDISEIEVVS